jgi:hypothetical protein
MRKAFGFCLLVTPPCVAVSWGVYLGTKWVASQLVASPLDQTVMAAIAVVLAHIVLGVGLQIKDNLPDWL